MDKYATEAQHLQDAQDAENESACHAAALQHGHTTASADNCDDGDRRCPNCPWKKTAKNWTGPVSQHFNAPVKRWLGISEQQIIDCLGC